MQTVKATAEQIVNIVKQHKSNNKVFGVCFIKKNGERRVMCCRFNVTAPLTTNNSSTTAHIPKYVTVFDMRKQAYRNVNLETLQHVVSQQVKYQLH